MRKPGLSVYLILFGLCFNSVHSKVWMGYYASWTDQRAGDCRVTPENIPVERYTHLIYSFAAIDGALGIPKEFEGSDIDLAKRFVAMKSRNPSLKVLAAFGGGDSKLLDDWSQLTNNTDRVNNFASKVVLWCRQYGFDGVDIDWEFPREQDRANVGPFFAALRTAFDQEATNSNSVTKLLLTSAVSAGAWQYNNYQPEKVLIYVDYLNVMNYDFYGSWTGTTGPLAPLYAPSKDISIDSGYQSMLARPGVAQYKTKLVFGFASYATTWNITGVTNPTVYNIATQGGTPGVCSRSSGYLSAGEIVELRKTGVTVSWDATTNTSYIITDTDFITFESSEAVALKLDYLKRNEYAGGMVWLVDGNTELTDQIWSALSAASNSTTTTSTTTTTPSPTDTPPIRVTGTGTGNALSIQLGLLVALIATALAF